MEMAIKSVRRKDRKLKKEMQRGKTQMLAKALEKIMYASGLGSVAQAERTEVTLQEESCQKHGSG